MQAAIGIAALDQLDAWTERTRLHARVMDQALGDLPGISVPKTPPDRTHVYYQYCVYGPLRDELVVKCVRRGIDVETLHVWMSVRISICSTARRSSLQARRGRIAPRAPCRYRCTHRSPTSRLPASLRCVVRTGVLARSTA